MIQVNSNLIDQIAIIIVHSSMDNKIITEAIRLREAKIILEQLLLEGDKDETLHLR